MSSHHYLEAVTVCVNYADILAETVPANRAHLDRWLIVTSPDDRATLDLCHKHNLEAVVTRDFYRDGDDFNKGRGIERGLGMLAHRDWLVHLDADIALPACFRESLDDADIDPVCIYGADRLLVQGWDAWQQLKAKGWLRRGWHCCVASNGYPVGTRWADIRYGYVPIGYFQLWNQAADHREGIRLRRYPDNHQNAARADVKFALQWDRRQRQLLPEVLVAHLESEPAENGKNWNGRKTKPFGPTSENHTFGPKPEHLKVVSAGTPATDAEWWPHHHDHHHPHWPVS